MKFIEATQKDLSFLFELRNERENAKYSKRGRIKLDEIEKDYLFNSKKNVYITELNGQSVGYLIFESLGRDEYEVSVAISVHHRGKGLGKKIVEKGTEFGINLLSAKQIIARIFPENKPSLSVFQANSYKIIDKRETPWLLTYNALEEKEEANKIVFIFDFDGVIVDSVGSLYDVYLDFLRAFGIQGNEEEFNSLNGPKLSEIISFLKINYGINADEKELLNVYLKKIALIYKNIKLNTGIKEILELLRRKHIKTIIASSSKKEEILTVLDRYNLNDFFEFIISGDDVKQAKPSPEIYNAIKKKYQNKDYFVVEDSENGLQAAIDAGMKTIFYNPMKKKVNKQYRYHIHSLLQIENIITESELNCFIVDRADNFSLKSIAYQPEINSSQREIVEKLWNDEMKNRHLFNGKILSYKSHVKNDNTLNIECFVTQYKFFFAQFSNPQLNLGITPIGVSGIIIDETNNTLLAIRQNVTEYHGYYELIPAGSIDSSAMDGNAILFQNQLIAEFEEESGISKDCIKAIHPFCLIFDKEHNVYDICSKIHIKGSLKDLLKARQNTEYENIEVLNLENLPKMIKTNFFVPTSQVILNNL